MATIRQLLTDGEQALADGDSPRLDAELLLACVLQQDRTWLYTNPDHIPTLPHQHLYLELVRRRQSGIPVAYLIGKKEFWNIELSITEDVLIPRPETETLVETALAKITPEAARVADLGTGSGAVALALAKERPAWEIWATDRSPEALALAKKNARALEIGNVEFAGGDWIAPLEQMSFDAVVGNPPYIDPEDPHLQEGGIRFEPARALISADHGLEDIKKIAGRSPAVLKPGGWLMLEHGYNQGGDVRKIFAAAGLGDIDTIRDLSGNDRVTIGRKG